jgi:serine protease Do
MRTLKRIMTGQRMVIGLMVALLLIGTSSFLSAGEKEIKKEGSGKGFLGVSIEKVSGDDREEFGVKFGVLVIKVQKDEAADKAGIKKYDVIQYFNDEIIRRSNDLVEAVRAAKPGTNAKIKLIRDGKQKNITVKLGEAKHHSYIWYGKNKKPFKHFYKHKGEGKDYSFHFNEDFKDGIKKRFKIKRFGGAFLGVNLSPVSESLGKYFGIKADGGALIMKIEKDSPASKAGLMDGDVIVKIGDKAITNPKDVVKYLSKKEKGDKVDIMVMRNKKKKSLKVELAEREGLSGFHILGDHLGKDVHIRAPRFHIVGPEHGDDEDVIILQKKYKDKSDKKKTEKLHKKLKKIEEKKGSGNSI